MKTSKRKTAPTPPPETREEQDARVARGVAAIQEICAAERLTFHHAIIIDSAGKITPTLQLIPLSLL